MNEAIKTKRLNGKNVVVIRGSKGLGHVIVAAAHAQGNVFLISGKGIEVLP